MEGRGWANKGLSPNSLNVIVTLRGGRGGGEVRDANLLEALQTMQITGMKCDVKVRGWGGGGMGLASQ